MFCLDTSVLIDLFNGIEKIKGKLESINNHQLCITPIILCELFKGAVHSQVTEHRLNFINAVLQQVDVLDFNEHACRIFGHDYLALKKSGKPIKDNDLMIAAMCKAHNCTIITTDKKHFSNIQGLHVEVW